MTGQDPSVDRVRRKHMPHDYRGHRPETLRCGCGWTTTSTLAAVVHGFMDHGWRRPPEGHWSRPRAARRRRATA